MATTLPLAVSKGAFAHTEPLAVACDTPHSFGIPYQDEQFESGGSLNRGCLQGNNPKSF